MLTMKATTLDTPRYAMWASPSKWAAYLTFTSVSTEASGSRTALPGHRPPRHRHFVCSWRKLTALPYLGCPRRDHGRGPPFG
jgi:hypothetical protein